MDFSDVSDGTRLAPVHPGEVLLHDYLEPLGITQHALAVAIGVPPRRINEIIHCKRAVTADTALRLACFFGMTSALWTGLQSAYDTEIVKGKIEPVLSRIPRFVPKPLPAAMNRLAA